MKIEINNNFEHPYAVFMLESQKIALDLVEHTIRDCCDLEGVYHDYLENINFKVEESSSEATFIFEDFSMIYSKIEGWIKTNQVDDEVYLISDGDLYKLDIGTQTFIHVYSNDHVQSVDLVSAYELGIA
ncbi:TPA: hypothetical protein ACVU43_004875 [Vibrio parahaemolyticus]|nr:hypothetical protein [Vibrio parahaemolyticus]